VRFSKIKYNPDKAKVELHWTTEEDGAAVEHILTSDSKPQPELPIALDAFREHVIELLQVGDAWLPVSLIVTGISLNEGEGEDPRRGIIITCRRALEKAHAPLMFNTPHLREATESSPLGTPGVFLDYMDDAIAQAEKAAAAYVHGHREQLSIFEKGTDPELADDDEVNAPKPRRRRKAEV
jgi:hypothetical protein